MTEGLRPLAFFTLGETGYGHTIRAGSIAERLSRNPNFEIIFLTHPNVSRELLEKRVFFNCPVRILPFNYQNPNESHKITSELPQNLTAIILDFPKQTWPNFEQIYGNIPIVAIYHSLFSPVNDEEISDFQEKKRRLLAEKNIQTLFLVVFDRCPNNPFYYNDTLVIPIPPIIKEIDEEQQNRILRELELEKGRYVLFTGGKEGNLIFNDLISNILSSQSSQNFFDFFSSRKLKLVINTNLDLLSNNPNIIVINNTPHLAELIDAAKLVIAKPGMQTLSEAVGYRTPLIFLPDKHPERRLRILDIQGIYGHSHLTLHFNFTIEDLFKAIQYALDKYEEIRNRLAEIPTNGAQIISEILTNYFNYPLVSPIKPRERFIPGKEPNFLSEKESKKRKVEALEAIQQLLIARLKKLNLPSTVILFGGFARGKLRENSDVDLLLVITKKDVNQLNEIFSLLNLNEEISQDRINSLQNGTYDALRIKTILELSWGRVELNVSVMTLDGYRKIFTPYFTYMNEELGKRISGKPYHITNFQGEDTTIPKVVYDPKPRRLSPANPRISGKVYLGVKQRMLLISETLHNTLDLPDPVKNLLKGITRAICFWNNLYKKNNEKIIGLKPCSFDVNYILRLLSEPPEGLNQEVIRRIKELYFNCLLRIHYFHNKEKQF